MLDPALFRGQLDAVADRLAVRGFVLDKARIEELESQRKAVQVQTQELQNQRNTRSKAIGMAKGKGEDTSALMAEVAGIGDQLKANETRLAEIQQQLAELTLRVPQPGVGIADDALILFQAQHMDALILRRVAAQDAARLCVIRATVDEPQLPVRVGLRGH